MKKWAVMIHGEGFLIEFEDGIRESGFYTTRWVEADSPDGAENLAVELIRDDERLLSITRHDSSQSPMLYAEKITELSSFEGNDPPGAGFTFYRESAEPMRDGEVRYYLVGNPKRHRRALWAVLLLGLTAVVMWLTLFRGLTPS